MRREAKYLNSADATTRYGLDHVGGALLIKTRIAITPAAGEDIARKSIRSDPSGVSRERYFTVSNVVYAH